MILTDYYRFERVASKAKTRLDCVASTKSYPPFEEKRCTRATKASDKRDAVNNGGLIIYYGNVPDKYKARQERKPDKSISIKGNNLSSVYVPDIEAPFAYGDFANTTDALLFVYDGLADINGAIQAGAVLEVFVARGKTGHQKGLYEMLVDGALDAELAALREQATKEAL